MPETLEDPLIVLDSIPGAYLRINRDLHITFVNQAAVEFFGKSREEMQGAGLLDAFPPQRVGTLAQELCGALERSSPADFSFFDNARRRSYTVWSTPDAQGGLVVRLSAGAYPNVLEIPAALPAFAFQAYVTDEKDWRFCYVHSRIVDLFGIDAEPLETALERLAGRLAPETRGPFLSTIREASRLERDWSFDGTLSGPDGRTRHFHGTAHPRRAGPRTLFDGMILDTTDQRSAENELRESEKLYRQIFEVESDALILADGESGRFLAANAAAWTLYGYNREEFLSLSPVDVSAEPEKTVEATSSRQKFIPLRWHRKKDGTIFPVEISSRYFDLKGRPVFIAAIRDLSERRLMEEALIQSEQKFSKAFHSNPAAITIMDLNDQAYLEVNETFETISGYRRDELVGRVASELGIWVDQQSSADAFAQILSLGHIRNREFQFRRKNGQTGCGLLSAELIEIAGRPCAITTIIDITDRIRLENELRQAQKLESLGRLAGGVAHDFNNLLTVINGYTALILHELNPQSHLYLPVLEIQKAGERAAGLTRQLLAFSRKQLIEPQAVDINAVVADAGHMLRRLIGEDIGLVTVLDPDLGLVLADPDQIHQVIVNLVVNARDAMPNGGRLEIATKNVEVDERAAAEHPDAVPGSYVLLKVTDNGVGISDAILPSIFDPFFTTNEHGKGTGLGLATVYGIVRQSLGWIQVSTRVGHGASFSIYLPRIPGHPLTASSSSTAATMLQGSETVLVVEDQEEVRTLTTAILKSYGYCILDAPNGDEALALAREHPEIDLLLTDVILPGMNGNQLAGRMRIYHPHLKVLFTSGYTDDVIARRGVLDLDAAYLPKPFTPESLAAKVREVLSGPPVAPTGIRATL